MRADAEGGAAPLPAVTCGYGLPKPVRRRTHSPNPTRATPTPIIVHQSPGPVVAISGDPATGGAVVEGRVEVEVGVDVDVAGAVLDGVGTVVEVGAGPNWACAAGARATGPTIDSRTAAARTMIFAPRLTTVPVTIDSSNAQGRSCSAATNYMRSYTRSIRDGRPSRRTGRSGCIRQTWRHTTSVHLPHARDAGPDPAACGARRRSIPVTSPGSTGRGPTRLISPTRTFHNCGSSSMDVQRRTLPIG